MRLRLRRLLATLALGLATAAAGAPLPADWSVQGRGEMRWFGLHIYDASLWAPGGKWRGNAPYALELRYARDIEGRRLVETSIDEMRRLGSLDEARHAAWRAALERVFPDVRSGDTILGLHRPAQGAEFYHQGRLTGRLDDPELAQAFFAIWLDPRTREPGLRARLLGEG